MNSTNQNDNDRALFLLFWSLVLAAGGLIGWKFFAAQEEPMETKVILVFSTAVFCALAFRWIRSKSLNHLLQKWTNEAIEWSDTAISAVCLAFLIMSLIVQAFKIPSGSMQPTLTIGDHLFVNKFIYGAQIPFTHQRLWRFKEPNHLDVIVFRCPTQALSEEEKRENIKKDFIKRAIGLPGDTIEIKDKVLYVNGKKAIDPYAHFFHSTIYPRPNLWKTNEDYQKSWEKGDFVYLPIEAVRDNFGPVKVPEKHYFVMGDNRDGSFDSRFWGPLPEERIKGKAWLLYWPLQRAQTIH